MGKIKKFEQWEIEKMKQLYHDGYNFSEIGRQLNRNQSVVSRKLIALGIKSNKKMLWDVLEIRDNIIDEQEAKQTTAQSHKKLLFKCSTPNCDNTKMMMVSHLVNYGYSCPNCSTGTSYPELFFISVNQHFKLGYEYQQAYEHGRFDFINHDTKTVVEMNGTAHYQEVGDSSSWTNAHKKTRLSDNKKREWCKENGYTLIFIDARESTFEFIQDNINKCELLPTITDEDIEPMLKIMEQNKRYPVKEIIDAYLRARKTTREIAEHFNYGHATIHRILKRNNVSLRDVNASQGKKIRCIETGVIYDSGHEAMRETGINQSNIGACCRGKKNSAGGYHWEYLTAAEENAFHRAQYRHDNSELDTIDLDESIDLVAMLNQRESIIH